MKWEMELDDIEAALEKILDLHDKLSDAILSISRAHFLSSVKSRRRLPEKKSKTHDDDDDGRSGFVFVKEFRVEEADDSAMIVEAKSLNAIRTALENLEDQLEFFQTIQMQQRAERDAAIARLEQSRIVLAMRLSEHCGTNHKVIEEALVFVGEVHAVGQSVSHENIYGHPSSHVENSAPHKRVCASLVKVFISSFDFAKKCLKLNQMGGILGNAALIAVSMIAMLHLQHTAAYRDRLESQERIIVHSNRNVRKSAGRSSRLDVFSARG